MDVFIMRSYSRRSATKSWLGVTLEPCCKTDIKSPFHPPLDKRPPPTHPPHPFTSSDWSNNRRHTFNSLNKQTPTREEERRPRKFFHLSVWLWRPPPARVFFSSVFVLPFFFSPYPLPSAAFSSLKPRYKEPFSHKCKALYISALPQHPPKRLLFNGSLDFFWLVSQVWRLSSRLWCEETTRTENQAAVSSPFNASSPLMSLLSAGFLAHFAQWITLTHQCVI